MVALQKDMNIRRMMVQDSHIAQGLKSCSGFFVRAEKDFMATSLRRTLVQHTNVDL